MNAIDYRAEAKKMLDLLPDSKIRVAFNLLEHLKRPDTNTESVSDITHSWLKCFTDSEKDELLEELLVAITDASSSGDWLQIQEVIESWEETAEVLSDEQLIAEIKEAEEQSKSGEIISWETARKKLGLG